MLGLIKWLHWKVLLPFWTNLHIGLAFYAAKTVKIPQLYQRWAHNHCGVTLQTIWATTPFWNAWVIVKKVLRVAANKSRTWKSEGEVWEKRGILASLSRGSLQSEKRIIALFYPHMNCLFSYASPFGLQLGIQWNNQFETRFVIKERFLGGIDYWAKKQLVILPEFPSRN